jgi:hypothetical protein
MELSGSQEILPSRRQFFRRVFDKWKQKPLAGRFYYNLLDTSRIDPLEFPAKFSRKAVLDVLAKLNRVEYFWRIYAEGRLHGTAGNPVVGCLVLGHRRPNGGPGYLAAVYPKEDAERCWFCSIVSDGAEGPGRIEVVTDDGWKDVPPEDVNDCASARVALAALQNHLRKVDGRPVASYEIEPSVDDEAPADAEYRRRIQATAKSRIPVTLARTPLSNLTPHSVDFCVKYHPDRLHSLVLRILHGYRPTMVVYWNGSTLVMSDDYPDYLAYQQARCSEVSVAILGKFPPEAVNVIRSGGLELLPAAACGTVGVPPEPFTARFKQWQVAEKHAGESRKALPSDLIAAWMILADMLSDAQVSERELHEFIFKHPAVLNAYGTSMSSELRLGENYRIDVVVRNSGVRPETTLVELEHHRHGIFTGAGQLRAEITHAVQQVQDWFRWLRENPISAVAEMLGGLPPAGLVVAGRSRDFSEDDRSRLAHLNANSPVSIITYDEVLDRLADLILSRLDDGN